MRAQVLVEVGIALAGLGVWLLAYWGALLLTRPRPVAAVPPTQDFGGAEPPAVVSLIAGRWELTEEAAESTLIDLAARKVIEFRQPGNDPLQTTVHVGPGRPAGLNAYETMVFERVRKLAVGGVVPLTALTFRDQAEAKGWADRLGAAVVADARSRGLSRRRFSPAIVTALTVVAAVPSLSLALAIALHGRGSGDAFAGAAVSILFMWTSLAIFAGRPIGERDTPEGRAAAARWLGLKTFLRAHESFTELPPAAVAVWDRYLSYGNAVGATRVCAAVIDLGMGNRRRVWSSFGGTWHRVKVKYPKHFPRYGKKATGLTLRGLAALAVTLVLVRFSPVLEPAWLTLAYAGYTLVGVVVDVLAPVTVTGEVLWVQVWKSSAKGEDSPAVPWLHHLAVDDGTADRTVAWACPSELIGRASPGDVVTLTARRWTRRVLSLRISSPRSRLSDISDFSVPVAPPSPFSEPVAPRSPAELVTADEAGRVLGRPVALAGGGRGPAAEFRAADGAALVVTVATGHAAELAIRPHRGGRPVPGAGDEAYASGQWAAARRGRTVVVLEQRSPGAVHQPHLVWLLGLAVDRLT